ncbi:hypothetical protein ABC977_02790 [Thioalkalicoccus limnaeus]|uniref:Cytochrome C n=1 Tax=Thioalkalicoccus limnaeus TaxID=120681 RepID=A0ABV4BA84_9GAMM
MLRPAILATLLAFAPMAVAQAPAPPADTRYLVEMPELQQQLLRREMQEHLLAYQRILGHLANGELAAAGEVAEQTMGVSTMGKHAAATRGLGGPGRFMPDGMRQMAFGMHEAATDFARVTKEDDLGAALRALQDLTGICAACHMAYRTR